jgi:hypothetical protein
MAFSRGVYPLFVVLAWCTPLWLKQSANLRRLASVTTETKKKDAKPFEEIQTAADNVGGNVGQKELQGVLQPHLRKQTINGDSQATTNDKDEMVHKESDEILSAIDDTKEDSKQSVLAKLQNPIMYSQDPMVTDDKPITLRIGRENVTLDMESSMQSDVDSIQHVTDQSQVLVNIKPNARCPRPFLVGRLSGPALIKLENWTFHDSGLGTTLTGTYRAPLAGKYFLEIIAIYCNDFSYNLASFDIHTTCVEDPRQGKNRLTSADAYISVSAVTDTRPGFWANKNANESSPVFTRYQPPECHSKGEPVPSYCAAVTSLEHVGHYDFKWQQEMDFAQMQQTRPTTVCYAGFSHARSIFEGWNALRLNSPQYAYLNVSLGWIKTKYPKGRNIFVFENR